MVLLFPGLIANVLVAFEHRAHAATHVVHSAGQVERGRRIAAFPFRNIAHGEIQAFLACRRIAAQGKATNGFPTFPGHVGGLQQIGDGIGAAVQVQRNGGLFLLRQVQKRLRFPRHGVEEIVMHQIDAIVVIVSAQKAHIAPHGMHKFALWPAIQRAILVRAHAPVAQIVLQAAKHGSGLHTRAPIGIGHGHDDHAHLPGSR